MPATQRALDLAKVAALAADDKLATTITASPRTGSPLAIHASPATASVNGRKIAA